MKLSLTALCAVVTALAVPTAASAAELAVAPVKPCYRSGESFSIGGTGYTPGAPVDVTVNGMTLQGSPLGADPASGDITSRLTLGQAQGQQKKTIVATDATNPARTGSVSLLVSAVTVNVKPKDGAAGHKVKIGARGFTTGTVLYAHVSKGDRVLRTMRIARLKGDCRTGKARQRLFSATTKAGKYKVQFDTRRKRSKQTTVKSVYTVTIYPMAQGGRAAATASPAAALGGQAVWARVG